MALNALGSSKPTPRLKIKTEVEAPEGVATDIEALVNESQSIIIKWKVCILERYQRLIKVISVGTRRIFFIWQNPTRI